MKAIVPRRIMISGLLRVALTVFVLGGTQLLWAQGVAKLNVSTFGETAIPSWPQYIGQLKGFFQQEGIEIKTFFLSSESQQLQAQLGGSLDITTMGSVTLINAVLKGADLAIVAAVVTRPPEVFVVTGDINSFADLKGKPIAISELFSSDSYVTKKLLESKRLKSGEYTLLQIGFSSARLAALQAGSVKGAILTFIAGQQALEAGFKQLADPKDLIDFPWNMINVKRDWAQKNRALLVRYLRALDRSISWMNTPRNAEEVIKFLAERTKTKDTLIAKTYEFMVSSRALQATLSEQVVEKAVDFMRETGDIKGSFEVKKIVDPSYLAEARR